LADVNLRCRALVVLESYVAPTDRCQTTLRVSLRHCITVYSLKV